MTDRDPAIDPRPGDELRGNPFCYRVMWQDGGDVRYELFKADGRYITTYRVSLSGWRDMAAGLTVEKVA